MEHLYENLQAIARDLSVMLPYLLACLALGWLLAFLLLRSAKLYAARTQAVTPLFFYNRLRRTGYYFSVALLLVLSIGPVAIEWPFAARYAQVVWMLFYFALGAMLIKLVFVLSDFIEHAYDVAQANNLLARKIRTQIEYVRRVLIVCIILICSSLVLLTFDSVRQLGIGLLSSAGVLGIIFGIAAQKSIGNLLAGLQIAFTQPIRIEDVVVVEGEWGRIEEITLTYVVVRIWDLRRLVLPLNYFIEKPFQNWTRTSADILGTVFLYVDYTLPVDRLRQQLQALLASNPLWDGQTGTLQVTNSTERSMEVRAVVSARNSSDAWDLRCWVREELIAFIQREYPHCLPQARNAWLGEGPTEPRPLP
jgi:small-conductance mechanosensitive channel